MARPLSFDPEQALDKAVAVFWEHGYEGASLPVLTKAMGINKPSLYATFGNKQELFEKALDRYTDSHATFMKDALKQPTARSAIEHLLLGAADFVTGKGHPGGCLVAQTAVTCGAEDEAVKQELIRRRQSAEDAIRLRLERGRAEGELPDDADPAALARFFAALIRGMATQAADGATREQLEHSAELAMLVWPT